MTPDASQALRLRSHSFRYEDYVADAQARIAFLLDKPCAYEPWRTQLAADLNSLMLGIQAQMEYFLRFDQKHHRLEDPALASHREVIAALPNMERLIGAEPNVIIPWMNPALQISPDDVVRRSPWYTVSVPPVMFDGETPVMHIRLAYAIAQRDERELSIVPSDLAFAFTGSIVDGAVRLPANPGPARWVLRHAGVDHPNMSSHIQCHEVGSKKTALLIIDPSGDTKVLWQVGTPTMYPLFPDLGV